MTALNAALIGCIFGFSALLLLARLPDASGDPGDDQPYGDGGQIPPDWPR